MEKTTKTKHQGGRKRLSDQPEFLIRLNEVLPSLLAREITITDASKYIGCSRRSLRRYMEEVRPEESSQMKSLHEQVTIQQLAIDRLSSWNRTDWDKILEDESVKGLINEWLES